MFMIGTFHSQFHIMFYMWLPLPNKGIITCHQLTCFLRQLLVIRIVMPPTLQNSPLLPLGHGLHIYIYISLMPSIWVYHAHVHITICFLCWFSMCLAYFLNSSGHWPIQYCNLAYIFALPFLMFFFHTRWQKKPPRDLHPPSSIHNRWLGDIVGRTHN